MAKHSPAPWEYENVEQPQDRSAYGVVKDADGKILFDTLNSDMAEIHDDYDEGSVQRWCEMSRVNLTLAAAAPKMLAALKAADAFGSHGLTADGVSVMDLVAQAIREAEGK